MSKVIPLYYNQNIIIFDSKNASNNNSGSLILKGGLNLASGINSVDTSSGSMVVAGGISISKDTYVGEYVNVKDVFVTNLTTTIGSLDSVNVLNITSENVIVTGAFNLNKISSIDQITTSTLLASNINGTNISAVSLISDSVTHNNMRVSELKINNATVSYVNTLNLLVNSQTVQNALISYETTGSLYITSTEDATNTDTGAFKIAGGLILSSNLTVGNVTVKGNMDIQGSTTNVNSTNASFADNVLVLNAVSGGSGLRDSGFGVFNQKSNIINNYFIKSVQPQRTIGGALYVLAGNSNTQFTMNDPLMNGNLVFSSILISFYEGVNAGFSSVVNTISYNSGVYTISLMNSLPNTPQAGDIIKLDVIENYTNTTDQIAWNTKRLGVPSNSTQIKFVSGLNTGTTRTVSSHSLINTDIEGNDWYDVQLTTSLPNVPQAGDEYIIVGSGLDYATQYYNPTTEQFTFAYTDSLPIVGDITPTSYINLHAHSFTGSNVVSLGVQANCLGGLTVSNQLLVGNANAININTTDVVVTGNITTGNLVVDGNLTLNQVYIQNSVFTNATITNALTNTLTCSNLIVSNSSTLGTLTISGIPVTPNTDDIISEKIYTLNNGISSPTTIFKVDQGGSKAFYAIVSVTLLTTGGANDLFAMYDFDGIKSSSGWVLNTSYIGNEVGVEFTIDGGNLQYTSSSIGNFVSSTMKIKLTSY